VPHGAGPGAAHLLGCAPATLDDDQRVEEFLFPVAPPPRLAPGERAERREDRTHVVLLDVRIAIGRLDAPYAEHHRRRNAEVLLDALEQRVILLGFFAPLRDPPVGDAAVDILPERLGELGLAAIERIDRGVGLEVAHHARIGRLRYAARQRPWLEGLDPLRERCAPDLL
jgi:hypothetical protein